MKNTTIISRLAVLFAAVTMLLSTTRVGAQTAAPDQRLITLHNGYQYLGYIVEQRPGKDLKLYRPAVNDTITVKLEEIAKVTRIAVKSTEERPAKIAAQPDSLKYIAKYNTKPHVFQVSFVSGLLLQDVTDPVGPSLGFGLAYYRSYKNKWFWGASFQQYVGYNQETFNGADYAGFKWNTRLQSLVAEGRMRLSGKPQNRRMSTLLGIQAGYMRSSGYFENFGVYRERYIIDTEHNFVGGGSVCFRINPDRNSGWSIEPMVTTFRPRTSGYYYTGNGLVASIVTREHRMTHVSVRCSYYF